jgi:RNA polymerase sigma-70 factor (ECF subfamily)
VQTALLAAHQAGDQGRSRTPEQRRGWLRRILLNALSKFRRRWRGRWRDVSREVALDRPPSARQQPPHLAHDETPSHVAGAEEQKQSLAEAVGGLPDEQQRIIAMHLDEELSFVEIGRRLGKSPDAVRMAYGRALERLRVLLPPPAVA